MFEGTTIETTDEVESTDPNETAEEALIVRTATDGTSRGDHAYLSGPRIDGNPGALVLV